MIPVEIIRETLRQVIDPEVGMNIVDLGLVYQIDSSETSIDVRMTLTTQGCPMSDYILGNVNKVLKELPEAPPANVNLVWEPAWSPQMINRAALE